MPCIIKVRPLDLKHSSTFRINIFSWTRSWIRQCERQIQCVLSRCTNPRKSYCQFHIWCNATANPHNKSCPRRSLKYTIQKRFSISEHDSSYIASYMDDSSEKKNRTLSATANTHSYEQNTCHVNAKCDVLVFDFCCLCWRLSAVPEHTLLLMLLLHACAMCAVLANAFNIGSGKQFICTPSEMERIFLFCSIPSCIH